MKKEQNGIEADIKFKWEALRLKKKKYKEIRGGDEA